MKLYSSNSNLHATFIRYENCDEKFETVYTQVVSRFPTHEHMVFACFPMPNGKKKQYHIIVLSEYRPPSSFYLKCENGSFITPVITLILEPEARVNGNLEYIIVESEWFLTSFKFSFFQKIVFYVKRVYALFRKQMRKLFKIEDNY
jgi:hypothetical protein